MNLNWERLMEKGILKFNPNSTVYSNYEYFENQYGNNACFVGEGTNGKCNGGFARYITCGGSIYEGYVDKNGEM